MDMANGRERLEYLDGLRGIAAVVVILHHAMLALHPAWADYKTHYFTSLALPFAPVAMLWQGNVAVCVFFVLSGYVLAPMSLRADHTLVGLIARRIVRLGLPILAALLFGFMLWKLNLYANVPASMAIGSQGWWDYQFTGTPKAWSLLRDVLKMPVAPSKSHYDPVVWTMHWEYLGSFGIFLIYRLFSGRRLRLIMMGMVLCATTNNYYFDFAAGALLFDLDLAGRAIALPPARRRMAIAGLLAGFVWFGCNTWSDGPGMRYSALDWLPNLLSGPHAEKAHQIAAVFLLAALIVSPVMKRVFSSRPALALGRVSFATYLLHFPLLCSLSAFIVLAMAPHGATSAALLATAALVVATLALSVPFTRLIDTPATRLSQKVGRRVDGWWNRHRAPLVGMLWHLVPHGRAS